MKVMPKIQPRALSLLFSILFALPEANNSAREQFEGFQTQLRASRQSKDWHSYLATARKMKLLLNEAPNSLLEVARAAVHVGDQKEAFRALKQFVRMGQSSDLIGASPEFFPLHGKPDYARIHSGIAANLLRFRSHR